MNKSTLGELFVLLGPAHQILLDSVCGRDGVYGQELARQLQPEIEKLKDVCENSGSATSITDFSLEKIDHVFNMINGAIMKADLDVFTGDDYEILRSINELRQRLDSDR